MQPLLNGIYHFLKFLVLVSFRIFYQDTVILNRRGLHLKGPVILVGNHPSTLTDPLHVAARMHRIVYFLANASLFQTRFTNWFFNTFFCIPIERQKDVGDRKISNSDSFARCDAFLSAGGCLYIAPEGESHLERRLQPLKTGTARIALSAEKVNAFALDLQILPVGLSYTAPMKFRSGVVINVGEAMDVRIYREIFEKNPVEAVRLITADLEERMRDLIIDTRDDAEDQMVQEIEWLLQGKEEVVLEKQFYRSKKLIGGLRMLEHKNPEQYALLRKNLETLSTGIAKTAGTFKSFATTKSTQASSGWIPGFFTFLLGFPFFIYGWVNNFLPNFFPGLLARKINLYVGYQSTVKLLSGLFLFYPLFYTLQLWLVQKYFANGWITLIYFISLYPLGVFAWNYRQRFSQWLRDQKLASWAKRNPDDFSVLNKTKSDILQVVDHVLTLV